MNKPDGNEEYHCQIAFVIQTNGIHMVVQDDDTHPEFGQALVCDANTSVQVVNFATMRKTCVSGYRIM